MTKKLTMICGCLFFAVMFGALGASFYADWLEKTRSSRRGWEAMKDNGKSVIYRVDSDGPSAELKVGDEIVSLQASSPDAFPVLYQDRCNAPTGSPYKLIVRRSGQNLELSLKTIPFRLSKRISNWALNLILLSFIGGSFVIFFLKPYDRQAGLLALMLGTFTGLFQGFAFGLSGFPLYVAMVASLIGLLFLPTFFHFFLIFPERSPLLRRFPRLEPLLYLPFLLTILPYNGLQRAGGYLGMDGLTRWLPARDWIRAAAMFFVLTYLIGGLVALVINYRAADAHSRRKLRFVVAGCGAGFINLLILVLCEFLAITRTHPQLYDWVRAPLLLTLPLVPLSFAYAIIRHQVIPISLIIRRSVRYVLVLRGAILLDMIAVGLSVTAVLTYIFSRTKPPGIVIGLVSAAVGIITWKIASGLHEKYLRPLIDRRFFRQSYDSQQIIAELSGALRTVKGLPQLLELVATRIQTALQTMNVTIFLRDPETGNYPIAYSRDYNEDDRRAISVPRSCQLTKSVAVIERASDNGQPVEITPNRFLDNKEKEEDEISDQDRETLREVKATLLMPLATTDESLGFISLGPRLGDLPFSREDKSLLMSVSGPATFAIENARLVEQMVAEARRLQEMEVDHRRKTEELAFARQLQLSMLPTRNLSHDHIDIIGQMRTATEVGGDYYDFIEMADDRICIAVGDATGHGMAAGLVVGMVKMGLINALQRLNGHTNVKSLVEDLNRALKRSLSQRGMGMCLGAAILNPSTMKVEVISNGMPAPYYYRSATRELIPVATQAPPLGFLRQINVRPVEMQLDHGDALIWLSDGFEERLNPENQIWGGEQVERTLERICGEEYSAESIARRMIEACDDAAGGRSNDDDMTIVVAKVKAGSINV